MAVKMSGQNLSFAWSLSLVCSMLLGEARCLLAMGGRTLWSSSQSLSDHIDILMAWVQKFYSPKQSLRNDHEISFVWCNHCNIVFHLDTFLYGAALCITFTEKSGQTKWDRKIKSKNAQVAKENKFITTLREEMITRASKMVRRLYMKVDQRFQQVEVRSFALPAPRNTYGSELAS